MTLIITELSHAGVAMVSDSKISFPNGNTEYHQKLFLVPKIHAAVSYWGAIGAIREKEFWKWFADAIHLWDYANIEQFANQMAEELNRECGNKILAEKSTAGVHIAGIDEWNDGKLGPVFYHVHNGHVTPEIQEANDEDVRSISDGTGSAIILPAHEYEPATETQRAARTWENNPTSVKVTMRNDPRKSFEAHRDFPRGRDVLADRLALRKGYITRNGDIGIYVWCPLSTI